MRRMYSKKQVEQIAQGAVSSGTKLYKHNIDFNVTEEDETERTFNLLCLTTFSSPITEFSSVLFPNDILEIIYLRDEVEDYFYYVNKLSFYNNTGNFELEALSSETGSWYQLDATLLDITSDTVTEL